MAKTLELSFKNQDGKITKLSIDDPIEPVDPVAVSAAMDSILTSDVFSSNGGDYVSKSGARVIERNVVEVEIA